MAKGSEYISMVMRFFEALDDIKAKGLIRGRQTFTTKYGINKRNMYFVEKNPESLMFDMSWIIFLVRDYGISPEWILLGSGAMYSRQRKRRKFANSSHPQIADV